MPVLVVLAVLYAIGGVFIVVGFVALFAGPGGKGVPFVMSRRSRVEAMVRLAKPQAGECMADLGSGDGRIVIAFARAGVEAHGYEINPVLVWYSRIRIRLAGLHKLAHIHFKNYWSEDLSRFTIVTIFGMRPMMGNLEKKLSGELKTGTRIVSNHSAFPTMKIIDKESDVLLYRR